MKKLNPLEKSILLKTVRAESLKYGIFPLLICLERLVKQEKYEFCQGIMDYIKDMNKYLETEFLIPTILNEEAVVWMKLQFMKDFNLSGYYASKNSETYADLMMMQFYKLEEKFNKP